MKLMTRVALMIAGSAGALLVSVAVAQVTPQNWCAADSNCNLSGCGAPVGAWCHCCSRGGNGYECCKGSCAGCAIPYKRDDL